MTAVRVTFVSKIPTPYRLPLYRRLAERPELEVEVLFASPAEPDLPWDLDGDLEDVPHRFLPGRPIRLPTGREPFLYHVNNEALAALAAGRPDLIVVGGYASFADQAAIAHARRRAVPYAVHNESHLAKPRPGWVRAVKAAGLPAVLRGAAGGLAVGSGAARYLARYGIHPGRIRVFPNTVDVAAYRSAADDAVARAAALRGELGLPARYLLYAGRLTPGKGIRDLAAALRLLGGDAPALLVAGKGPLAAELDALPTVRLLGFQPTARLIELMALASATVLPSRAETWGVVVNESLACRCPVVVSDAVGAVEDLLVDGVDGRVFPAGDVAALASAITGELPAGAGRGRILRWDYEFAVDQFLELVRIVFPGRLE